MSNGIYTATGQVIDRDTNEGVAKLSVEAWDTNTQRAQAPLGKAMTDDNGRFSITMDLKKLQYEQAPDLFFKVFLNEQLVDSTESSVLWNANTQESVTIRIRTTRTRPDRVGRAHDLDGRTRGPVPTRHATDGGPEFALEPRGLGSGGTRGHSPRATTTCGTRTAAPGSTRTFEHDRHDDPLLSWCRHRASLLCAVRGCVFVS